MTDLNALIIFAKVVEANSFSEAARRLNMPISTVSRRVADLEEQLGVRLLERSTRYLRLTEIGQEVFEQGQRSVELRDAIESVISNRVSTVSGTLRLSSPPSVSDTILSPIISTFQASYPNVRVHALVTNRYVDHIADGVDLAVRIGALKDSALVARRLFSFRERLVASPNYLTTRQPPKSPRDLLDHRLITFWYGRSEASWSLHNRESGETEVVTFTPHFSMNDFVGLARALVEGAGIGELPPVVQPGLIRDGGLVEVLPHWRLPSSDVSLVHSGNRNTPLLVRLFIEVAVQLAPAIFHEFEPS